MSKQRQQAFLDLYQPVHDRFERFCRARAYASMPYEDLINETLLVAYRQMDKLQPSASFLNFLIGISLKILANARKKKRAQTIDDEWILNNHADTSNTVDKNMDVAFLHHALAHLPEKQREALILFEITGFSIKEIMEIQSSGASAVKQRLARGRDALAKIVSQAMQVRKEGSYES